MQFIMLLSVKKVDSEENFAENGKTNFQNLTHSRGGSKILK